MNNVSTSNIIRIASNASNLVNNSELLETIKNSELLTDYFHGVDVTLKNVEKFYSGFIETNDKIETIDEFLINLIHNCVFGHIWENFPGGNNKEFNIETFKLILYIIKNKIELRYWKTTGSQWEKNDVIKYISFIVKDDPVIELKKYKREVTLEDHFLLMSYDNPLKRDTIYYNSQEEREKKVNLYSKGFFNANYSYDSFFNNNCYILHCSNGEKISFGLPKYFDDDNIELKEVIHHDYEGVLSPRLFEDYKITSDDEKEKILREKHHQLIKILECLEK